MRVISMDEIKKLNEKMGGHFFSFATTKFFHSLYPLYALSVDGKIAYFVTSEKFGPGVNRRYTIRHCDLETGACSSKSLFQEYATLRAAEKAIREILKKAEESEVKTNDCCKS